MTEPTNAIEELQQTILLIASSLHDIGEELDHLQAQVTAQSTAIKAVIDMNHMIAEELGWLK